MTDLRKAAQMALDWRDKNGELLFALGGWDFIFEINNWSQSLRGALAQPEPEPVAWITDGGKGELWWHQSVKFDDDGNLIGENPDDIPLYTAPPQREWIGLTDEEIREFEIWLDDEEEKHGWNPPADIVKYIEAKLKEKNEKL